MPADDVTAEAGDLRSDKMQSTTASVSDSTGKTIAEELHGTTGYADSNVIYDDTLSAEELGVPPLSDCANSVQPTHNFVAPPAAAPALGTPSDSAPSPGGAETGAPPVPAPGVIFNVGPGAEVLGGDMSVPPPHAPQDLFFQAVVGGQQLPPIHCSEFLQAVIEKQHEVERYLHAPTQDIHPPTLMKMAMMKNELDLLSSCIAGVLGKGQLMVQAGIAPGGGQPQAMVHDPRFLAPGSTGQVVGQQIWPIEPPVEAAELRIPPEAVVAAPYVNGQLIDNHAPATMQMPEDHQGPAIFQGFQPPPSYAWGRGEVQEQDSPEISPEQQLAPDALLQSSSAAAPAIPRPRTVDTSSPLRPPPDAPMKLALVAAMEKLQEARSTCARLRRERRGVPTEEVEQWCNTIAERLQAASGALETKLEAYKKKSKLKDDTIKRLHTRLQATERLLNAAGSSRGEEGDATYGRATDWPGDGLAYRGLSNDGHNRSEGSLLLDSSGYVAPPYMGTVAAPPPWTPGDTLITSLSDGDSLLGEAGATTPAALFPEAGPCMSGGASSSSHAGGQEDKLTGASPRVLAEKPQPHAAISRREAALLRRRDADLAGQLRARDQQVEQLSTTLRELHIVTQRQIGLYKRQLHLKDCMLDKDRSNGQALAEHGALRRDRRQVPASAPSASTLLAAASMSGAQTPSMGPPQGVARGGRAGTTPRRADTDRSRGGPAYPAYTGPKKEPRDKSAGGQPHSPRTKNREVVVAEVAAPQRRRISPTTPTTTPPLGRPGSAEPPRQLRRNGSQAPPLRNDGDSVAAAAATKVIRYRDGAPAQRIVRR